MAEDLYMFCNLHPWIVIDVAYYAAYIKDFIHFQKTLWEVCDEKATSHFKIWAYKHKWLIQHK